MNDVIDFKSVVTFVLLVALYESHAAAVIERYQLVRPLHLLDLCLVDQHPVSAVLRKSCQEESCIAN